MSKPTRFEGNRNTSITHKALVLLEGKNNTSFMEWDLGGNRLPCLKVPLQRWHLPGPPLRALHVSPLNVQWGRAGGRQGRPKGWRNKAVLCKGKIAKTAEVGGGEAKWADAEPGPMRRAGSLPLGASRIPCIVLGWAERQHCSRGRVTHRLMPRELKPERFQAPIVLLFLLRPLLCQPAEANFRNRRFHRLFSGCLKKAVESYIKLRLFISEQDSQMLNKRDPQKQPPREHLVQF